MLSRDSKLSAALVPMLASPCLVGELLTTICEWVAETSHSEHVKLFLVDQEREELCCRASTTSTNLKLRIPIGIGLHGHALANKEARTAHSDDDHTMLVLPIFAQVSKLQDRSVIGMLELTAPHGRSFQAEEEHRFHEVATSVARVLTCARMDDSRNAPAHITDVIGDSEVMRALYSRIDHVSATRMPIVLQGSHGTGKTLLARVIHSLSSRRQAKFIAIQCHREHVLLETELFGISGRIQGSLERAAGGTLLVEQMNILSTSAQHELVAKAHVTDTRIIATLLPNQQLPELQSHERISVPPLAERGQHDVAMLIRYFARRWTDRTQRPTLSVSPLAVARLCKLAWPGNVRQLENSVQHTLLSDNNESVASLAHTDDGMHQTTPWIPSGLRLADAEERYILRTLAENNENRTHTASALGIGRNTLVRKIKQYRNK